MKKISLPKINLSPSALKPGKKMLAIEVNGAFLLGAVVEKRGGKLRVNNFVSLDRSNPSDDIPDPANIKELLERLDYQEGKAILITPLARSVQISMNRSKVEKLRQYQLVDSLRWEVEPYTGIAGTQALVGAERGSPVENEDILILTEDEEELDVNVSVTEQNVYRAMKQIFKRSRLKLIRVYPPESCFYMPLFIEPVEGAQAVFDIGTDYANFTLVRGGSPKQISTVPLGKEILQDMISTSMESDTKQSLDFLLKQVPGPLPMIVTGIGATDPDIVAYLDRNCEPGAYALTISRRTSLSGADHDTMNAMFAVVAGGAIRELSGKKYQLIGITDAIPLPVKIRESGHLLPLVATTALAVGLFAHYGYMKTSNERYLAKNKELSAELKKRKQANDAYTKLEKKLTDTKKEISNKKKQIQYLKEGSDSDLAHIEKVLESFYLLPKTILLDSIKQGENDTFVLAGLARDITAVNDFAVQLQEFPWCKAVYIKEMVFNAQKQFNFNLEMETDPEADTAEKSQ